MKTRLHEVHCLYDITEVKLGEVVYIKNKIIIKK